MKVKTIITRTDHEFMIFDVRGTNELVKRETAVVYEVDFIMKGMTLHADVKLLTAETEDLTQKEIAKLIQQRFVGALKEAGASFNDPED